MKDLLQIAPKARIDNFLRSKDFLAAGRQLADLPRTSVLHKTRGQCLAHPLVALAFLRWLDEDAFYKTLYTHLKGMTNE